MDKERSEWVKKYMAEKGCTKQSAYEAYSKSQAQSQAVSESKAEKSGKSKVNPEIQVQKSTETQPAIVKSQVTCPTCKGSGRVPISSKPKEKELTELPRLLPRRLC